MLNTNVGQIAWENDNEIKSDNILFLVFSSDFGHITHH